MRLLVTGGCGFIGSNFIRRLLRNGSKHEVTNLDSLSYCGNPENLSGVDEHPQYRFVQGDICDRALVERVIRRGFDAVVNFAAETHVDRSIHDAAPFLRSNVIGVHSLLEGARRHRVPLFVQISTDEVYGSAPKDVSFKEEAPLGAGSPYSASKCAADHLVHAYVNTFGVAAIILRCTNNYGPYQFPEKVIPLAIANALENRPIPVYGDGLQERDWLFVEDYCSAIEGILQRGKAGETYNVASGVQRTNIALLRIILQQLGKSDSLMQFVQDRPGHDRRYCIDNGKIYREIGWRPTVSFADGIRTTISWYLNNKDWIERVRSGAYREYYDRQYRRGPAVIRPAA
jgi:dTDP-glucose 4,6-dehydratase